MVLNPRQPTGQKPMSFFARRQASASQAASVPRSAQIILRAFARANGGLFILDGPAIGTDPDRRGDELDIYCVFDPARTPDAIAAAQGALSGTLPGAKLSIFGKRDMSGELMTYVSRRGVVLGERRAARR